MTSSVITVPNAAGTGQILCRSSRASASSILVLGHGAGGGVAAADLELLARSLPVLGTTVVRFEQPWRTAGRSVGAPPPRLDEAWLAALSWLVEQEWAEHPLSWAAEAQAPGWLAVPPPKRIPPRSCASRSRCISQADLRSPAQQSCWPPLHQVGLAGHQGQLRQSRRDSCRDRSKPGHHRRGLAGSRSWLPNRHQSAIRSERSEQSNRDRKSDHLYARRSSYDCRIRGERIHRRRGGNIDIMTALHLTCRCCWIDWTISRCCAARHYSRT